MGQLQDEALEYVKSQTLSNATVNSAASLDFINQAFSTGSQLACEGTGASSLFCDLAITAFDFALELGVRTWDFNELGGITWYLKLKRDSGDCAVPVNEFTTIKPLDSENLVLTQDLYRVYGNLHSISDKDRFVFALQDDRISLAQFNFDGIPEGLIIELRQFINQGASFIEEGSRRFEFGSQTIDETLYGSFCLLYTSPSPRDRTRSRMPSSA